MSASRFAHPDSRSSVAMVLVLAVIAVAIGREVIAVYHEVDQRTRLVADQADRYAHGTADDLEFTLEALFEAGAHDAVRRVVQQKALADHIDSIFVLNEQGTIIASSNAMEVGWHLNSSPFAHLGEAVISARREAVSLNMEHIRDGRRGWIALIPVEGGEYGATRPPAIAVLRVDFGWLDAQAARSIREIIFWGAISTILLAVTLWLILSRLVTSPIERLRNALLQSAHTDTFVAPARMPRNEIGEIAAVVGSVFGKLEESRAQLANLALVAERTNNLVIITDAQSRIEWVNEAFTQITGYTSEEVIGRAPGTFLQGPDTDPRTVSFIRSRLQRGIGFQTEILNYRKDGSPYWLSMDVQPIRDDSGDILKFIAVEEDITQRKQTEIALRRQRELYDLASRISNVGGWEVDLETNELSWTAQTLRIHEVADDYEPTLEMALSFYPPEDRELVSTSVDRAIAHGGDWDLETEFITAKGRRIWVHSRGRAVVENGKVVRLVGSFQDITNKKLAEQERETMLSEVQRARDIAEQHAADLAAQAIQLEAAREQAEAASASKTEFLANMSHEIRTPMTAILGFADLIDEAKAEQRQAHIQTIRRNGEHLLAIINDILDLSKIESGKMTVEKIECSAIEIVEEVISIMRVRAEGKNLTISASYETAVPETIATDPVRFRQILMNLLGNAIKFTEAGSIRVAFAMQESEGGNRLLIRVKDTGIGIAEETLPQLFQPFSQADTSTTRRFGGTGLGLQISRRLANLLGGTITVSSKVGLGSEFTLSIETGDLTGTAMLSPKQIKTRVAGTPSLPSVESAPSRTDADTLEGVRVLLCEDGPDNQRLITHYMTKAGAEVQLAQNGQVAIDRLNADSEPFDLILMDMQMPVLDGYSATRQLREQGRTLPIIALTAHAMPGDRTKCLEAGCDEFLTKPINRQQLVSTCRKFVDQDRERRTAA